MPFTEKDFCVAKAVVSWLNAVAARSDAEAAESLSAASQCVQCVCHLFCIVDGFLWLVLRHLALKMLRVM